MLRMMVLVAALGGCLGDDLSGSFPLPRVSIHLLDGTGAEHIRGALAWQDLGFRIEEAPATPVRPECGRWWERPPEEWDLCEVSLGIEVDPLLLERSGTLGMADRRTRLATVDDSLSGDDLLRTVAHEVGHILLDTAEHTSTGVMAGTSYRLQDEDFELACHEIGICDR